MMHWIAHVLGLDNASGAWYLGWSGFGSDITEFAILGAFWHAVNCHEPGCWRIGFRITEEPGGIHVRRCRHHHHQRHTEKGSAL